MVFWTENPGVPGSIPGLGTIFVYVQAFNGPPFPLVLSYVTRCKIWATVLGPAAGLSRHMHDNDFPPAALYFPTNRGF